MSAIMHFVWKGLSSMAMSLIMNMLSEKYLKRYAAELIIPWLKRIAADTATPVDDQAVKILEDAFKEPTPPTP